MNQTNLLGETIGYINFAPFLVRTPVINSHNLEFPISWVHHPHHRPKWQMGMRRRQSLGVEMLSIGRLAPVETRSVPAGIASPSLNRLRSFREVSYQGSFHGGSNKEH